MILRESGQRSGTSRPRCQCGRGRHHAQTLQIGTKVRKEVTARCHAAITTPIGDSGRQLPLSYTARASVRTPLQRRGPQSTHSSILITVGVAARVSKGCHRKFRGHNFESCVTNFDKISFFSLRSRYGKFRGFHPSYYKIRSVSDLQNPTATPLTQAGAAHRGTRLSGDVGGWGRRWRDS